MAIMLARRGEQGQASMKIEAAKPHSGRPEPGRSSKSQFERGMKPTVMIVEDEEALSTLLQYNLAKEGYSLLTASDGEEAALLIRESAPDLVLLDWMLPGLSGIELCRQLRGRPETRNMPIIIITARGEEADRIRGLDTGADDYVTKPFSITELLARIRAVLRRIRPALTEEVVTFGDIVIDRVAHRVRRGGRAPPNTACSSI